MSTESLGEHFLPREKLQVLLDTLIASGYDCMGPQVRDGAIVFDALDAVDQLPRGIRDEQSPGRYRLIATAGVENFSWSNGPQAIKPQVFRPTEPMWTATEQADGTLCFRPERPQTCRTALIGVRACDLAALFIQDKHFLQQDYKDEHYKARRQDLFLVAVNCTQAASTCFCVSTGDGPRVRYGYDLAMTELEAGFVLHAHSEMGRDLLLKLPTQTATETHQRDAWQATEQARVQQRALPGRNLRDALFANLDHPRWTEVAERCLACGNCTAVCPTCFCNHEFDHASLDGKTSTHSRQWDSCFNPDHGHVHGAHLRESTRDQYRQWLTHKLGSWHDQYDRSGCVGCGRCIAWCPAGIDLVEEVLAICEPTPHD